MQGRDRLGAEADAGEAEQGHADADMGERRAPERQRQPGRPPQRDAGARPGRHARVKISVSVPMMTKIAMPAAIAARIDRPLQPSRAGDRDERAGGEGDRQTLHDAEQVAALPGEREADRGREAGGQQKHAAGHIEERRADGDLLAGQLLERERIERAEEHRRAGRGQQEVVEHQRALARDRREQAALPQHRRTPGEQRERAER